MSSSENRIKITDRNAITPHPEMIIAITSIISSSRLPYLQKSSVKKIVHQTSGSTLLE
jgi:hypothetical protein